MGRRCQRLGDSAKSGGAQAVGLCIGAHGVVEIAGFLKRYAEIEHGFGKIRLDVDRLAVGGGSAGMVAQILAHEAEIEPDRGRSISTDRAFEVRRGQRMIAVLESQPPEPRRGLLVQRDGLEDGLPRLPRLRSATGLIQRSCHFQECVALRRDRNRAVQMRQRGRKIADRARDAGGEKQRGAAIRVGRKA